jgi:hypothetical protein
MVEPAKKSSLGALHTWSSLGTEVKPVVSTTASLKASGLDACLKALSAL